MTDYRDRARRKEGEGERKEMKTLKNQARKLKVEEEKDQGPLKNGGPHIVWAQYFNAGLHNVLRTIEMTLTFCLHRNIKKLP